MDLERRLQRRYDQLVRSHMVSSDLLSAGVKSSLKSNKAFSRTQAAWRFFNNERCSLTELIKPILSSATEQMSQLCNAYVLIADDWSGLSYKKHERKKDRFGIHNKQELGYELQASLSLNEQTGTPIAPITLNLATNTEVFSTYREDVSREESHLEELAKRVQYIEQMGFNKPLIHIVDREGDSVQWMRALKGAQWLIRSRSNSHVRYNNASRRVDKLAAKLDYCQSRTINYKGQKATQYLAEATVSVTRSALPKKKNDEGKRTRIKGEAVDCRLVVSRVEDTQGKVLAWWYLLTNASVDKGTIALWYYWRWSIESFFKLLKTAGMHLESWQQETGHAVARRLLIACMACVCVWQIAEMTGAQASELRDVLIKLSGRQMKYGVAFTRPALFAGLCALMNALQVVESYDIKKLKQLLRHVIGEALV